MWLCLFCLWVKKNPGRRGSARRIFEKLCERPIEMVECEMCWPAGPPSGGGVEVELKISYREGWCQDFRICVLYRDWLYRTKISKKFWRAKLGRGCWRYRRPIGRDDAREGLVWAWYRSWPYRKQIWSKILVQSWSKSQKVLETGREKSPEGRNALKSL